ncbi:ATP-binding cassette domain-containing protein [Aestuariibaculum sp. YM273]|uniref:peptidase domain-containing ABC transporter n=1 Tax=Aestuariibaculum sp. YM273 TaxID=3070659 RepID=UPI0027DC5201|nr:ATP-binding cassette domain-containing protein [Aestuariibaculum sp. YM273]WMI64924.1 ATP-binding cassette domain-containing protein [Aestuariibaculum sp. YM273]
MKNNSVLSPWKRFLGLVQLEKKDIFRVAYFAIFEGILALTLPLGIQAIITLLQGGQVSTSWIVLVVLVTSGVAFTGILKLIQIRIIESIQQRIFARASFDLAYRFPKIKMNEMRNYYLPELANRFFDTLTIQKGLSKILIDIPSAFLQVIFALILLSFYHPFFIFFGLLLLGLIFVVFKYTAKKGLDTSLKESKYKYRMAHWLEEIARTVISFKLSGKTSLAIDKTDDLVLDYVNGREKHFKILMLQFKQMISFKVIVTAGLLLVGGYLVLEQQMNIGQFVAAEIIIILIIASVEKLILSLESFYDVLTSIEKLGQVVDKSIENQYGEEVSKARPFTIELKNAGYRVANRKKPILEDISLKIEPTDRVLIQGESGAGKSSLLQLISGVVAPTDGFIYIDNLSIESLQINKYRSLLGMVLSEESPFEGTIRENVTFGNKDITDEEIFEVFEKVGLSTFLKRQSEGLNTLLKPEGKQIPYFISAKLLLSRAILKKPKVLILEEPLKQFNDKESEKIFEYLCDKSNPWSVVVVSNLNFWKRMCNKHIILEEGHIINS